MEHPVLFNSSTRNTCHRVYQNIGNVIKIKLHTVSHLERQKKSRFLSFDTPCIIMCEYSVRYPLNTSLITYYFFGQLIGYLNRLYYKAIMNEKRS